MAKPKIEVVDLDGAFVAPYKKFVRLTHIPRGLVPSNYHRVSLKTLSKLFGRRILGLRDLGKVIEERGLRWWGDNSYNFNWWGPTTDFKVVELPNGRTLAVVGLHLGGDVRWGYKYHYFIVDKPFNEVNPWADIFGSVAIMITVETPEGTVTAMSRDVEGVEWDIYPDTPYSREVINQALASVW